MLYGISMARESVRISYPSNAMRQRRGAAL
jgi:hypothetical protein